MSQENNGQIAARTVHAYDLESREEILITYFPVAGIVTINGFSVTRAQRRDDIDGQLVFVRHTDNKTFAVDKFGLTKLYI